MSDGEFDSWLAPELRGGDDPALWRDALCRVAEDVAGLDRDLETPPRHVLLSIVRIRGGKPGAHPDDRPTLRLAWERDRGDSGWRFAGAHPRTRSRHGSYTATLCLPAGTNALAWVEAVVLWRPHVPWAAPEDHETGRQAYRYRREAGGSWSFLGIHEE
jgi:hypothetical protein